jgi:Flp pilus assembly protein TadG
MRSKSLQNRRSGTQSVECAVVYPVIFFFVLATFTGGIGIFQYQQVAHLAREAARYASAHGGQYQQENDTAIQAGTLPNVTEAYIKSNIINPQLTWMKPSDVQVTILFNQPSGSAGWDATGNRWPTTQYTDPNSGSQYSVTNTVTVTVTYNWYPLLFIVGPITLTSTSVMPMTY